MDRQVLRGELKDIIGAYLKAQGFELVELIYRYEGRDLFLRVLADRTEGGITIGECGSLNRQLSGILDEKDILQEKYTLEVSSPGVGRPLKTKNDFLRCLNKQARFFLSERISGKIEWEGVINKVEDNIVSIEAGGGIIELPLERIITAKQSIY